MKISASLLMLIPLLFIYGASAANWAGTWTLVNQTITDCIPASPLTITQTSNTVTVSFIFVNNSYCEEGGLNGTSYNSGAIVIPTGNELTVEIPDGGIDIPASFELSSTNPNELSASGSDGNVYIYTRPNSALILSSLSMMISFLIMVFISI